MYILKQLFFSISVNRGIFSHYSPRFQRIIVNYIEKRRDEVSAHTVIFLKIVSQNARDCISAHIHFKKKFGGGGGRRTPLRGLSPSATKDFSPK